LFCADKLMDIISSTYLINKTSAKDFKREAYLSMKYKVRARDLIMIKEFEKFGSGKYRDITALKFAKMIGIARSTLCKYIKQLET
jgi:hypothetical protein